ncbi:MAG: peptide-methionine (R)-S-oxide reductase MsrB [Novosphingobium sp.]|nr:peptide-methionine (R)-S-oxide reductase MsrB [Novosphingobium sp.]
MPHARRSFLAWLGTVSALSFASACGAAAPAKAKTKSFPVTRTDAEWRKLLTPRQYTILRKHGTERPGSSPLNKEQRKGTFVCAADRNPLYSSATKFESGTGWPSFWKPLLGAIGTSIDRSLLMERTEVHCAKCGGHLGHVFKDGPKPTGLRYCMNGDAMLFVPG